MNVHIHDNVLQFSGQGHGAKGQNDYRFNLAFLLPVNPEVSYKSTQRQVTITVRKAQRGWWDRLTVQERKPAFLAPDFDRWLDESDAEMEIREKFLGFSWIFINMTVRLFIFGQDSLYDTFHTMSDAMFLCQTLAAVEVLNAAFGVVKTGVEFWLKSIPIFDEAKLFSIDLTKFIGTSIRFSHFLYAYLIVMAIVPFAASTINFRHLYKQRKRRFRTNKRKEN
ncbi:hypothetical protein NHX12_002774 [Muraenolepis orangiensis]|uniref:CS domain-containing protein n=1 Tax=Muraenolepis orangiensis TaxID=630683 RepID=A0A9Q0IGN6_9TELE|nr:hypothetical protein NHX12_002774 [Muraenolepis orangiensis]